MLTFPPQSEIKPIFQAREEDVPVAVLGRGVPLGLVVAVVTVGGRDRRRVGAASRVDRMCRLALLKTQFSFRVFGQGI